jgi:hypothetical protein
MNERELQVAHELVEHGFTVMTKGWPDLLVKSVTAPDLVLGLELKSKGDRLQAHQEEMHRRLPFPVVTSVYEYAVENFMREACNLLFAADDPRRGGRYTFHFERQRIADLMGWSEAAYLFGRTIV